MEHRTTRIPTRRLTIGLAVLLAAAVLVPAAALAAGGSFTDDDTSIFEADIEWLAGAGVTRGCNPPDNTLFCPDDGVTRGQMAAFMRRFAQFLGAEDGVVDLAETAHELSGFDAGELMTRGSSVYDNGPIEIPGTGWVEMLSLDGLPRGSYLVIAKGWLRHAGSPAAGSQFASCRLLAGQNADTTTATLLEANVGLPASWTVVNTFWADDNSAELQCWDNGNDITLNDAKITAISLHYLTNAPG